MKKIKVILVDDHAVVRAGYKILLKDIDDIEVAAEAENGNEAIELIKNNKYDVIVTDMSLPDIGGIDLIRKIKTINSDFKILVFSMHEEIVYVEQALHSGAMGYMTKSADPPLIS